MARPEKVEAVRSIAERFNDSSAALLTEYRGLTVGEMAEVRGSLRTAGAEYRVLKNTLARIAVREVGLDELIEMLEGPTAIVFTRGDAVEAAKALDEVARKYPVLIVKGGVLKGKVIGPDQARALARLESREVLLSKIAMLANSPLQQTANVLSALLRDLGSMLAQVVSKKESGELPGGEAAAASGPSDEVTGPDEAAPTADSATGQTIDEPAEATEEAPTEEAEEAPTEEAEEAPTEEAPTEEAPTEEAPTEEAPTEEAPTKEEG